MVQCEFCVAIIQPYAEQFPKIGVNSPNLPPPLFTLITVSDKNVAYRNSSLVDRSMLGALTRVSPRK